MRLGFRSRLIHDVSSSTKQSTLNFYSVADIGIIIAEL